MKKRTEELFKNGNTNYQQIKELTEKKVVDWFWSKGSPVELEPYYHEEYKSPKTKKLKSEPKNKNYHTQYGVDSSGNILIEREFNSIGFYEIFYQLEEELITSFRYSYEKEKTIINCKSYIFNKGKVESIYSSAIYGISHIKYSYKKNILVSKEEEHYNRKNKEISNEEVIYEYDKHNILNGIRSGSYYRYQRKTALSFTKLKSEAEKRVISLLKEHIKEVAPKEKIFTINLAYSPQYYFPPSISYGLESEREKWLNKKDAQDYIWNVAEYELSYDDIDSTEEDNNLFDELNQQIMMNEKHNVAIKSIINIAFTLKECLSEFDLNVTDDFVVVTSDYESIDLKKNFKILNPEKFNTFKNKLP